jgi:hypothetical protein
MATPWDDCKVAFGIDDAAPFDDVSSPKSVWDHPLPKGWQLVEIDGAGARYVAVFRVSVMPTVEDGKAVRRWLRRIHAI